MALTPPPSRSARLQTALLNTRIPRPTPVPDPDHEELVLSQWIRRCEDTQDLIDAQSEVLDTDDTVRVSYDGRTMRGTVRS